tara:strand:- start:679 stop:1119 length:441 start_codon:yes stop_codon:yes gene_type:complete
MGSTITMKTLQFEGVKVALKQDKTGYVLTLSMHPDDIPEDLLRDFVGARYQVVMVRLDTNEAPIDRQEEFAGDRALRIAGMLCRDPKFWEFLYSRSDISTKDYETATQWLRFYLDLESRSQLKTNAVAQTQLDKLYREYTLWQGKT